MVIEEYRCNIYDKHKETETTWARIADSVSFYCVWYWMVVPFLTLFDIYPTIVS